MRVVCFGDSLTSCGGEGGRFSDILQDRWPGHVFVNRGVGGEGFEDALARLDKDVLAERPDVVLVEFGANDWWRDERPAAAWAADLETVVSRIREGGAHVVVLGVFGPYLDEAGRRVEKLYGIDERAVAYRQMERTVAETCGCLYVPNIQERIIGRRRCWRDANHPNEYGNRFVAESLAPVLEPLLGEAPIDARRPTLETTRDFWMEATMLAPDRLAVVDGDRRLTYGEADGQVTRMAANLARLSGVERPTVAVLLSNCIEYYLIYWAVARLGGVIVPLSTWLTEENLRGIFGNLAPDLVVVRSAKDEMVIRVTRASGCSCVALQGSEDMPGWEALTAAGAAPPCPDLDADALSIVMHTSGTTGTPKGAMMRHSDLMFNVAAAISAHRFDGADVHLLVNPMFHCTALYSSLPVAAYTKTPVVIASPKDPRVLMELVEKEGLTTFLSVPSVFQQLLKVPGLDQYDASSLRVMAYAGSPMPVRTIRALKEHFPDVALHNFFGLTETISMTHVMAADEEGDRMSSIGRLLPFVCARVVDEDGAELPSGDVGELLFARENVIPGYFGQPGRIEESLVTLDGREWFKTGDLACVDADGYFFIRGRKKDMIIVAGENVYAAEVEAMLLSHPGVSEAAVKGAPATGAASFLGEEVRAWVVVADAALNEAALRRYCFERLPSFKVPRKIVLTDALPRNPSGKVVKDKLI